MDAVAAVATASATANAIASAPQQHKEEEGNGELSMELPTLTRQKSEIELELERNSVQAEVLVKQASTYQEQPHFQYDMELKGCVFVGHTNTDLDSIAAAIAASDLYGGTPARASEINTETEWVLKYWGFECPEFFAEIEGVRNRDVCLVDFNQRSQLTKGLMESQIKGIIDHHALRDGAVAVDFPIYIDVRPWGSVATILSHNYFRNRKKLPKKVAGLLLSAILSDTLNLNSPTCTDIDKLMVATLSKIAGVKDVDGMAQQQFKAKSKMILRYSIPETIRGDLKRFSIKDVMIAFGVCETTDTKTVLDKAGELTEEMRAMKAEKQDTFVFFAIIDVAKLTSKLLICGEAERELAEKAYDAKMDAKTWTMDLGDRVSRKKTMVPPLGTLIKTGFKLSENAEAENKKALSKETQEQIGKLQMVYDKNCVGEIRRVGTKFKKAANAIKALKTFGKLQKKN